LSVANFPEIIRKLIITEMPLSSQISGWFPENLLLRRSAHLKLLFVSILQKSYLHVERERERERERNSQLGITQEGKVKGPIWISFQPGSHSQSKPIIEALEGLHVPCPHFIIAHTAAAHTHHHYHPHTKSSSLIPTTLIKTK
jgi:hypothetical protein